MKTNEYKFFISDCKKSIIKNKTIDITYNIEDLSLINFKNYAVSKNKLANLRLKYINNIDELLISLDKKFTRNGSNINWSIDYNNLIDEIMEYLTKKKIREVNVFESKFIQELGVVKSLKLEGINICSNSTKAVILEPKYAICQTGSLFLDFQSAIEMEIFYQAKFIILIFPFNNLLKNLEDIELLSQIYSINKNKSQYLSLSTIYTPNIYNKNSAELFLVDNGRTNILKSKEHRKTLTCIECDACKNVCPVYSLIGDKPYNNVYTGPVANVVLPFLETIDGSKHLSFNCTLCGNCVKVCPMNIPIKDLIIANRNMFFKYRNIDFENRYRITILKKQLVSRKKLNKKVWRKRIQFKFFIRMKLKISRPLPKFSKITFSKEFSQNENKN